MAARDGPAAWSSCEWIACGTSQICELMQRPGRVAALLLPRSSDRRLHGEAGLATRAAPVCRLGRANTALHSAALLSGVQRASCTHHHQEQQDIAADSAMVMQPSYWTSSDAPEARVSFLSHPGHGTPWICGARTCVRRRERGAEGYMRVGRAVVASPT
ncbi:hypothetical protein GCM10010353_51260 [Streptomyces chryseus]|nr:hypothetical protein GCM10010353_51260 [Streptomyces chryseus]